MCVCVCVSVGALMAELFDPWSQNLVQGLARAFGGGEGGAPYFSMRYNSF